MTKEKPHYLYVNESIYADYKISKIGISYYPDKRILSFNNGLKHRYKNGFASKLISFNRFFTIKIDIKKARKVESLFKKLNKNFLLNQYGVEVFNIPPEQAVKDIYNILGGFNGKN